MIVKRPEVTEREKESSLSNAQGSTAQGEQRSNSSQGACKRGCNARKLQFNGSADACDKNL
eukprot:6184119-Pleurochrysis_carterae.AAC.1